MLQHSLRQLIYLYFQEVRVGVHKGRDNFKVFRASKQQSALELLRTELDKARRRKMPYPNKATLLSDMSERTKLHRTTLVRNPLYHRMLLEFLAVQAGGSTIVSDKDAPPELLRAKLIDAQMEIGRLHAQIARTSRMETSKANRATFETSHESESAAHGAFADTVWALRKVLERVNLDGDVFQIDMDQCEIRDLAAAPGRRIVVSGQRLRPFIEALRRLMEQEQ